MQLAVTRQLRRRDRQRDLSPWALVGFTVGVGLGFVLGELFGRGPGRTAGRLVRRGRRPGTVGGLGGRAAAASRILEALANDPVLIATDFEVIPAGRSALEVHGWVATRALRARAFRLAQAAADRDTVINCVLVRGEDDTATPTLSMTDSA